MVFTASAGAYRTKCDDCVHSAVCSIKEQKTALDSQISEMQKLLENREFEIKVNCKHWQKNNGTERTMFNSPIPE